MYCPECAAEYRPGFSVCNTCDVALVEGEAPDLDALRWTPETSLGQRGTLLFLLAAIQWGLSGFLLLGSALFAVLAPKGSMAVGAVYAACGLFNVWLAFGMLVTRNRRVLHGIYAALLLDSVYFVLAFGMIGFIGAAICGAWFLYFSRRETLFKPSPAEERRRSQLDL